MSESLNLKALKEIEKDLDKLKKKANERGMKERLKVMEQYIIIKGEKYYSEEDIMDAYAADCFTCAQCDKYLDKLREKKGIDWGSLETLHEIIGRIYSGILTDIREEIKELEQ